MSRIEFDSYLIDTLMPDLVGHDRQPAAFLVFLYLSKQAADDGAECTVRSLRQIAEGTGLSKRAVQSAITTLVRRKLVTVSRATITAVPEYCVHRPWVGKKQ